MKRDALPPQRGISMPSATPRARPGARPGAVQGALPDAVPNTVRGEVHDAVRDGMKGAVPTTPPGAMPAAGMTRPALRQAACAPYRVAGRWAWYWYWARGKLARDPVFHSLLEQGHLQPAGRVVNVGCGQGLLAAVLHADAQAAARRDWPAARRAAPPVTRYLGIDLMPRATRHAQAALGRLRWPGGQAPHFRYTDMRLAPLPACDVVVMLDVLHHANHAAQHALLRRAQAALGRLRWPGGQAPQFLCTDMRLAPLPACDVVVMLDVQRNWSA